MEQQVIPAGYQQTEVGVIPEDWEVKPLFEVTEPNRPICYGIVQTGPYQTNGVPCLRVVDIVNGKIHTNGLITTTQEISKSYRRTILQEGDLVLPLRGKVGEVGLVGKDLAGANLTRGVALIALRGCLVPEYIKHYLSSEHSSARLLASMNGSALQEITIDTLRKFLVAMPTDREQAAIATALSDTDALINELEKHIQKKQAIKTATMQQLLTGKTRLPQFALREDGTKKGMKESEVGEVPEDWEVLPISELFDYQNGKAQEHYFNPHDGYKVISIGNYSETGDYIDNGSYISRSLKNEIGKFVLKRGDLAMILNDKTAVGTIIGRVILVDADDTYVMNQRTMRLSPRNVADAVYMHYLINSDSIHKRIVGMAKPGTQIYVNTDDILEFKLQMPTNSEEKREISNILFNMNNETKALYHHLSKTNQIKQGMMQELLTGRTRLIKPEDRGVEDAT